MTVFRHLLSLILFGRLRSLIKLHASFKALNQITSQNDYNDFAAKTRFNEFQRHEETLLYGTILSAAQREKQNLLFQKLPNDSLVHSLFVGRYIQKDGQAVRHSVLETVLFLFGCVVLLTATAATIRIGLDVALLSVPLATKLGFILTLFAVLGFPTYHLIGRYLAPAYTYLTYFHKL